MIYSFLVYSLLSFLLPTYSDTATAAAVSKHATVYISQDQGATWEDFENGLEDGTFTRTVFQHGGQLFLITDGHGVYTMPVGATKWEPTNAGLPPNLDVNSIAGDGNYLAIGTYRKGVYISKDGGAHWQRPIFNVKGSNLGDSPAIGNSVRALAFYQGRLIAGTDTGIFYSGYDGIGWTKAEESLEQINSLVVHNDKLYAARRDGILLSEDGGGSWSLIRAGDNPYRFYAQGSYLYAQLQTNELIRTGDDGATWDKFTPIKGLQCIPQKTYPDALWYGTQPVLPDGSQPRYVVETSLGWIAGLGGGC